VFFVVLIGLGIILLFVKTIMGTCWSAKKGTTNVVNSGTKPTDSSFASSNSSSASSISKPNNTNNNSSTGSRVSLNTSNINSTAIPLQRSGKNNTSADNNNVNVYDNDNSDSNGPRSKEELNKNNKKPKESAKNINPKKKVELLFDKYKSVDADQSEEMEEELINAEGIEKFCRDLELDTEDPVLLVISYHLNAFELGCFYRDEFCNGLGKLKLDSIEGIKKYISTWRKELESVSTLKQIYRFVFNLGKNRLSSKVYWYRYGCRILVTFIRNAILSCQEVC